MKLLIAVLLCILLPYSVLCGNPLPEEKTVIPCADFTMNFCNFPLAWTVSRGEGVNIAIAHRDKKKSEHIAKRVAKLAPGSKVETISITQLLEPATAVEKYHIIQVASLKESEASQLVKTVIKLTEKGITVILPAYFGPMKKGHDYRAWRESVKEASQQGAVIVGAFGRMYQLGDSSFWKKFPVDVYALHTGIDGGRYFNPSALVESNLEDCAYLVTGAAALLKATDAKFEPSHIKKFIHGRGRKVFWTHLQAEFEKGKPDQQLRGFLNFKSIDAWMERWKKYNPKKFDIFRGSCLDAGLLLNLAPMLDGNWTINALKVKAAIRHATGKGVVVAILDHMFDKEDMILKGRMVKPGSVVGEDVFGIAGHGTWMAHDLIRVAPDVKIMPVRFTSDEKRGADYYIKGINYAVKNGADIISISHRAVPKDRESDLDKAIEEATAKGVSVVYIHYNGKHREVIISGAIEFAAWDRHKEMCFVVGTNFIHESRFPFTWGLSQTAPVVAGVIAMIKQLKPGLSPLAIKELLLKSTSPTQDGYPLLDAEKAVSQL